MVIMMVQVGISDLGRFGENGVEIKNPNFPYRLLSISCCEKLKISYCNHCKNCEYNLVEWGDQLTGGPVD